MTSIGEPKTALCQLGFPDSSLASMFELAHAVGADGVSISDRPMKGLDKTSPGDSSASRGRKVALGFPDPWTILPPLGGTIAPGPLNLQTRLEQMVTSVHTLADFQPESIMICTGPAGDRPLGEARAIVVDGIRALAAAAREAGTRLSIEPMRESFRAVRSIVCSLPETLELLNDVDDPGVGITFDIWHMWDSPEVHALIPDCRKLFHAVQVADYRAETRGPMDRVEAGAGIADVPRFLRELRASGFDGWYDLEIFSDDGRFGSAYEDSLWKLPQEQYAARQMKGFFACWDASD